MGTPKVLTLMFHGVVKDIPEYVTYSGGRTCLLRQDDFESIIRWCVGRHRILHLSELDDFLTSQSTETAVLLTFDDGLASIVDFAAPVLKAYGVSATVFVATQWLKAGRTPAIFLLERDLWTSVPGSVQIQCGEEVFYRTFGSRQELGEVLEAIWSFLLSSDTAPLVLRPEQVTLNGESWNMDQVVESRDFWFPATLEELQQGVEEGVFEIGAHGVTHEPWTSLTTDQLSNHLAQCRDELEGMFGRPVQSCSYPHGLTDSRVAEETGQVFRWAFTTHRGDGPLSLQTPRTLLPRVHVPSERPFWASGIIRHHLAAAILRRAGSFVNRVYRGVVESRFLA